MSNPGQSFDLPRKASSTFGRQPEELHIPPSVSLPPTTMSNMSNNMARHHSARDYSLHPTDVEAAAVAAAGHGHGHGQFPSSASVHPLSLQAAAAGPYLSGNRNNSLSSTALPGALQPGNVSRPHAISTNTAPSILPTIPQLSMQSQQQAAAAAAAASSVRPANLHSHSRSSPAGFEQPRYRQQGSSTDDGGKYAASSSLNSGGMNAYPPPRTTALSPLGLADIRPSADLRPDPGSRPSNEDVQVPGNSNYIAPWPIYAMDWCKWPVHGGGSYGGKIAFGSYLEDSHNYVWTFIFTCFCLKFNI